MQIFDNIIFVSDGGSWRQKIPIPSFMIEEYKGNRELDPNINWDMIFSHYEEFVKLLDGVYEKDDDNIFK